MTRHPLIATLIAALLHHAAVQGASDHATTLAAAADARIAAMKDHPRGPFKRIRWFCRDGTELPPEPHACREHGGGSQHGEWSDDTLALRAAGFRIANIYADLDIDALLDAPRVDVELGQMAIERFLVNTDDGWILRRARFYRGAFQEEGERAGARRLLLRMAAAPAWTERRFLTWRSLAAALPHGADNNDASDVRQAATALASADQRFLDLKNKIHISPEAGDAAAVRRYAEASDSDSNRAAALALADSIDALYSIDPGQALDQVLAKLDGKVPAVAQLIARERAALAPAAPAAARLRASGALLRALRDTLGEVQRATTKLTLVDSGFVIEAIHFAAATDIAAQLAGLSRRERLVHLAASLDALYGVGLLSSRQLATAHNHVTALDADTLPLTVYRARLDDLGRVTAWGDRQLNFVFGDAMNRLGQIEPHARLYIQDQLRGSPMFFYADLVDTLLLDANRLAGVSQRLFGRDTGGHLRALNPGIARGVLRDGRGLALHEFTADGIYLLPETVADLPPVAGIITAGEGNPLSHVQLLARNLGIPNVSIDTSLLDMLGAHQNQRVVLAVSSGGAVQLSADDPRFDAMFKAQAEKPQHLIDPDLDKLDLSLRTVVDLADLRADDSGRSVGPKAAKLGELKSLYPEAVANGVALPFGIFRALLDGPAPDDSGRTMFEYIVAGYRALEAMPPASEARAAATDTLRRGIESWVAAARLDAATEKDLRAKLTTILGTDGSFGVFVRSDTNVEDLPGFTGAGLNLTVPNVVGIDNIIEAIPRVWASPFTARAFSWRQALMTKPEHVYPAVLLLESVNADKSGVLVTQDIESGDREWLSVAVNEGVGGAVDGQSAESLRIHMPSARVRLLAQASAPLRREVTTAGGVDKRLASGADSVLTKAEIAQLIRFAAELPERFPAVIDADGRPAPADVEFGFLDGRLKLFQIRPFLDSPAARANEHLAGMDPDPAALAAVTVDLKEIPHAP